MNKLTDYQQSILREMKTRNAIIRTTEGKDYKVWLSYPNGNSLTVRKDTANSLFLKGFITLNEKSKSNFYEYIYTGKKIS